MGLTALGRFFNKPLRSLKNQFRASFSIIVTELLESQKSRLVLELSQMSWFSRKELYIPSRSGPKKEDSKKLRLFKLMNRCEELSNKGAEGNHL